MALMIVWRSDPIGRPDMSRMLRTRSIMFAAIAAAAIYSMFLPDSAQASCLEGSQQLAPQKVADFTANPSQMLTENPEGGAGLISGIRDLAASDPATLSV